MVKREVTLSSQSTFKHFWHLSKTCCICYWQRPLLWKM